MKQAQTHREREGEENTAAIGATSPRNRDGQTLAVRLHYHRDDWAAQRSVIGAAPQHTAEGIKGWYTPNLEGRSAKTKKRFSVIRYLDLVQIVGRTLMAKERSVG